MAVTKEKIPFTERFNKFTGFVKNLIYLLGILGVICTTIIITINKTFDYKIAELNNNITLFINQIAGEIRNEMNAVEIILDGRIDDIETYIQQNIESLILRQGQKVSAPDTSDVKEQDVLDVINFFPLIENKTSERVRVAYELVREYYIRNIK